MEQVNIIGIDLAKRSFQLHGARADGSIAFRRKVSREKFLYFLAALSRCVVAMEACASAHHWGRERHCQTNWIGPVRPTIGLASV